MLLLTAQMVIHLALQFLMDGFPQFADIAVRLPTHSGKPGRRQSNGTTTMSMIFWILTGMFA